MHRGRAFILLGDLCLRHCVFVALCFCFCHAFLLPVNVRNPSLGARLMQCTSSPRVLYEETLFSPSTTIFGDWNSERTIRILFLVTWNLVRSSFQLLLFPFLFSFLLTFFFFFCHSFDDEREKTLVMLSPALIDREHSSVSAVFPGNNAVADLCTQSRNRFI